jgi:hypothetical protein
MSATTYADLIIPELWQAYIPAKVPVLAKLIGSRAVYKDSNPPFSGRGIYAYQPFLKEFTTDLIIPTAATNMNIQSLTSDKDILACIYRSIAVGEEDAPIRRTGDDLLNTFLQGQAVYMAKQYEKRLYYLLKGLFATSGALETTHQCTDYTSGTITISAITAAKSKFSDNAENLKTVIMHGKVFGDLLQNGLVTYVSASTLGYDVAIRGQIPTVAGMEIIVSDLANSGGSPTIYSTYLLGDNALYFANPFFEVAKDRNILLAGGTTYAVYNTDFCVHCPGVKMALSSKTNLTDAELYTATTWAKVADHDKDIPIVELLTK